MNEGRKIKWSIVRMDGFTDEILAHYFEVKEDGHLVLEDWIDFDNESCAEVVAAYSPGSWRLIKR